MCFSCEKHLALKADISEKTLLNNHKYLDMWTGLTKMETLGVAILLRFSPNLKTFFLKGNQDGYIKMIEEYY